MPPDRSLRASDADRERVAAELGDHLAVGRLDTMEFEERLSAAYAARTLGDLDALLTDLPAERPRPGGSPAVPVEKAPPAGGVPEAAAVRRPPRYGSWLAVSMIVVAVWGVSSVASGDLQRFWPIWVIGPWGLALFLGALRGGCHLGHPGHGRR